MKTRHTLLFFVVMLMGISQPAKSADLLVEHNGARVFSVNQNGVWFFPLSVRELSATPVVSQGCIFSRSNVNLLWTTDPDRVNIKGRFIEPVTDTANWIMLRNTATGKRAAVTDEGDIPLDGGEPNLTMDDLYIDNHIIQKDISNGTVIEYCNFGDGRIEYPVAGNVLREDRYFYVKDHLGSTRIIEKSDGATAEFVAYDGYGAIIRSEVTGADHATKEKFTGKEFDTSGMIPGGVACGLRLDYFGARYYDPDVGIWINPDPEDVFWNPFSYVGGRTLLLTDPDGRNPIAGMVTGLIVGAAIGGVVGGVVAHNNGSEIWQGVAVGMITGAAIGALTGDLIQNYSSFACQTANFVIQSTPKDLDFVSETRNALNFFWETSREMRRLIRQLHRSGQEIYIRRAETAEAFGADPLNEGNSAQPFDKDTWLEGGKTGGTIVWDPSNEVGRPDEFGNTIRPPEVGLAHELGHQIDYVTGDYKKLPILGGKYQNPGKELNAMKYENVMRRIFQTLDPKLGLRLYY